MSVATRARKAPARTSVRTWDGAPLACLSVRDEAPGVKTFCIAPTDGSRIKFHAGQNLTLDWPMDGERHMRTFTIASAPTLTSHVELTVKAQPGGSVTNDMHRRLREGTEVTAFGPGGRFGLAFHPAQAVLMVSAGSGITPMMSMLRAIRDRRYESDVHLVHAAATPSDMLFVDELLAVTRERPNVTVTLVPSRVPPGTGWLGPRGRLTRSLLHALVPDAKHRATFLCGPPAFRTAMRRSLRAEGADSQRIFEETFHPAEPAPPATAIHEGALTLTLARSGRAIEARADTTIYQALKREGVVVPTACRAGVCGTCRLSKIAGEVFMTHHGGLSGEHERAGQILACCSYPVGPVTLDL